MREVMPYISFFIILVTNVTVLYVTLTKRHKNIVHANVRPTTSAVYKNAKKKVYN